MSAITGVSPIKSNARIPIYTARHYAALASSPKLRRRENRLVQIAERRERERSLT
jgi:hypothetical protein